MVQIIFDKYVHEGFGAQRIATYLNKQGYRARTGKMWHHASIRGIVCNLTYTGVLRCGESRSQELPHLQIISPELFEAAQHIRTSRANSAEQERHIPLNTRGNSLLAGNVYCGHCGARLSLTTNGKAYQGRAAFSDTITRAKSRCEEYAESRLYDRDGSRGAQFSLEHNFRWKYDNVEAEKTGEMKALVDMIRRPAPNRDIKDFEE